MAGLRPLARWGLARRGRASGRSAHLLGLVLEMHGCEEDCRMSGATVSLGAVGHSRRPLAGPSMFLMARCEVEVLGDDPRLLGVRRSDRFSICQAWEVRNAGARGECVEAPCRVLARGSKGTREWTHFMTIFDAF